MEIDITTFKDSLRKFSFNETEINAIILRLQKHIYPQMQAIQVHAKVKQNACGQKLLKAMLELKYNPDKNMMPTVKRIESSNGGVTTYLRHDAVVKYCNENFFSKHSV